MKKIYSKILILMLLALTNIKNLFAENDTHLNSGGLLGDVMEKPDPTLLEKITNNTKISLVLPILVIVIIIFGIYIFFKTKKNNLQKK